MAYPDYVQLVGSRRVNFAGKEVVRSKSGKIRSRLHYPQVFKGFEIVHELDVADYETFMQFYEDNLGSVFDFTWQRTGEVFQCQFSEQDVEEEELSGTLTKVTVSMYVVN